ncbi:MAG: response regulator [Flavobacteriales bacterium]
MRKCIALIDDDSIFNFLHHEMISRIFPEATIYQFNSGLEWIEYLSTNPDESFSTIYLDIRMPGMNGFEVLEAMQNMPNHVFRNSAIYVLSSTLDENDLIRSKANPLVRDFTNKPLTFEQIESH